MRLLSKPIAVFRIFQEERALVKGMPVSKWWGWALLRMYSGQEERKRSNVLMESGGQHSRVKRKVTLREIRQQMLRI